MGNYIHQDVRNQLNGMCGVFMVDVGGLFAGFHEKRQESDQ